MTILDAPHSFSLILNGVDYWPYLTITDTLRMVQAEGSQVDTLAFELEDLDWAVAPREFLEVQWVADGTDVLFGGYIVSAKPRVSEARDRTTWTIKSESWVTLFSRTPRIRKTWVNAAVNDIVADLFSLAGLAGYDTSTHVATSPALDVFVANGEHLAELLDILRDRCAGALGQLWTWRVAPNKAVWLGQASSDPAPFAIADIELADYVLSFPPSGDPDKDIDATQIRNRITVLGGVSASDVQVDEFAGDDATYLFNLDYQPVRSIVEITLDGALQRYGWDWVDDYGDACDVLVNFEAGTLRYPDGAPPGTGKLLVVKYKHDVLIKTVRVSAASHAYYGIYFDYELEDRTITNATMAEQAGDAMLAAYAFGSVQGTVVVERLGIQAGQLLTITFPLLGLTGGYVARQVTTELGQGGDHVICTIQYGGQHDRLSSAVAKKDQAAYGQPNVPRYSGDIQAMLVKGYDGVGAGEFIAP